MICDECKEDAVVYNNNSGLCYNCHIKKYPLKKYKLKWKFLTLYGWSRRQLTCYADNMQEAKKQMFPFNFEIDKLISCERVK